MIGMVLVRSGGVTLFATRNPFSPTHTERNWYLDVLVVVLWSWRFDLPHAAHSFRAEHDDASKASADRSAEDSRRWASTTTVRATGARDWQLGDF